MTPRSPAHAAVFRAVFRAFSLAFFLAFSCALTSCAQPPPAPAPGPALPLEYALADTSGRPAALGQVLGGRVAVIDFWATWCKPCRRSLPELERLARERAGSDLLIIAVNVGEDREPALAFAEELGLTVPIFFDRSMELLPQIDIHALPALLVIDADGTIAHRGKTLDQTVRAHIDRLTGTPKHEN